MSNDYQITATNAQAPFTLKLHRGDGMTLLAMNWRQGKPPNSFVGFAIEYKKPGGQRYFVVKNRLAFADGDRVNPNRLSSLVSPIQKFRWVHFPPSADDPGDFVYRVTPVFMGVDGVLSYGESQEAAIRLHRETHPGQLNVTFTRGFVSSQAFVDRYVTDTDGMNTLLPSNADEGLDFEPTHPKAAEALEWMGFEARAAILEVLDQAIADPSAKVRVIAYDLNEPDILARLKRLRRRLEIIIDNSRDHGHADSAETQAATQLTATAGASRVKRHHMSGLQHNKVILVDGAKKVVICGSTNFTWRGLFVQSNNALVLEGASALQPFWDAFDGYWEHNSVVDFGPTRPARWTSLGLTNVHATVTFSPHDKESQVLQDIADDIDNATSSVFYSLAFLHQTGGAVTDAIKRAHRKRDLFVYGISDRKTGGLDVGLPSGKIAPVYPSNLADHLPEPFKSEPSGLAGERGFGGTRMHHKFVVIDFDKPTARVYTGSYNFSGPADVENGENLLLIKDRRVAVSYMIQALTLFDHYHFRVVQKGTGGVRKKLTLQKPPSRRGEKAWWAEDFTDPRKIRDRELFA